MKNLHDINVKLNTFFIKFLVFLVLYIVILSPFNEKEVSRMDASQEMFGYNNICYPLNLITIIIYNSMDIYYYYLTFHINVNLL